jgi:hypothetical protein
MTEQERNLLAMLLLEQQAGPRPQAGYQMSPPQYASAESYTPPRWSDRLAYGIADILENFGVDGRKAVERGRTASGIASALPGSPLPVQGGVTDAKQAYGRGDWGGVASGTAEAALGLLSPLLAAGAAARMSPRVPRPDVPPAPPRDIWSKENLARGRDRVYDAERSGSKVFDDAVDVMNRARKESGTQPVRGGPEMEKEFKRSLNPFDRWTYEDMKLTGNLPVWASPTHLGLQAGNVAANDWLWSMGIMPWSWRKPGTLTEDLLRERPPEDPEAKAAKGRAWAKDLGEQSPLWREPGYGIDPRSKLQRNTSFWDLVSGGQGRREGDLPKSPMSYPETDQFMTPHYDNVPSDQRIGDYRRWKR